MTLLVTPALAGRHRFAAVEAPASGAVLGSVLLNSMGSIKIHVLLGSVNYVHVCLLGYAVGQDTILFKPLKRAPDVTHAVRCERHALGLCDGLEVPLLIG